jgi:hypothetical protein
MVVSAAAIVALAAVVFGALKFLFWINSVVFLGLMERQLPRAYWRWTPAELVLSALASICFSAAMILRIDGWLLAAPFGLTSLSWLAYMARRVWLMSQPRRV